MRPVEVKHLRRRDVDLVKKLVYVRRSKNETSHRVIPLNASAIEAIARMLERADLLGHTEPDHFLWPACQWGRYDPTQPMLKWDTAWRALRDAAGLPRFRFHDLRHTVITELAELGVADHVLESISGHLSRRMLEHYSHIRIDAKRQALDALDNARRSAESDGDKGGDQNGETNGDDSKAPNNGGEFPLLVALSESLTSQSRHSLALAGSPPSAKLLIPLSPACRERAKRVERRDGRVVEGARLESVCRGNSTEGSNPSLSANLAPLDWRRETASVVIGPPATPRPEDRIPHRVTRPGRNGRRPVMIGPATPARRPNPSARLRSADNATASMVIAPSATPRPTIEAPPPSPRRHTQRLNRSPRC